MFFIGGLFSQWGSILSIYYFVGKHSWLLLFGEVFPEAGGEILSV